MVSLFTASGHPEYFIFYVFFTPEMLPPPDRLSGSGPGEGHRKTGQ